MTVEEIRGNSGGEFDDFPKGMRVLAVDDDPTCLKLLDGLLRKCQYHVTATSQARTALNMLRENRNRFDLIISDVYMPDMDGFKLLELVGLEMDLPVISLCAQILQRSCKQGGQVYSHLDLTGVIGTRSSIESDTSASRAKRSGKWNLFAIIIYFLHLGNRLS